MIVYCRYSSKAKFAVTSKAAALDFGTRDIQLALLAFVSVFERARMIWKRLWDFAVWAGSTLQLGKRSNQSTYIFFWRGERCLDTIASG